MSRGLSGPGLRSGSGAVAWDCHDGRGCAFHLCICAVPVIAAFYGMIVRMYHADHNPPHFHVQYGEASAIIDLKTGRLVAGSLPPRLVRITNEWRRLRLRELERAWADAQAMRAPRRIKPLE